MPFSKTTALVLALVLFHFLTGKAVCAVEHISLDTAGDAGSKSVNTAHIKDYNKGNCNDAILLREDFDWSRVDTVFERWDKPGSPGCVVGVIHKGELVYQNGYGEANLDHGLPITPETVFYIASISKQFVAATVAIMAEKGLIDLDEDIREYIPELPDYGTPVLVKHLPWHTSGIRDLFQVLNFAEFNLADAFTIEDKLEVITAQSELNFPPGEEHLYSNAGYTLMAVLVERVTGQSLREFAHENIFMPLGMNNSHFHDDHRQIVRNRALSYQMRGDGEFYVSYRGNYQGVGADGLYTTIGDMLKWDRNLYNNRLEHAPGLNDIMHERGILNNGDTINYAFGLRKGDHRGLKTVGHSGSLMGFRSNYLRIPCQEFSVIVFSNLGSVNPASLTAEVADLYLEELFAEKMSKYEGVYVNPDHDTKCEIKMENGKLMLVRPMSPRGEMTHTGKGRFTAGGWTFQFYRDENGNIAGFKVDSGRARNVVYERI